MLSIARRISGTFFSRSFYGDLAHRRRGIGAGFMLLLLVLNFGPTFALVAFRTGTGLDWRELIENMPEMGLPNYGACIDASYRFHAPREADREATFNPAHVRNAVLAGDVQGNAAISIACDDRFTEDRAKAVEFLNGVSSVMFSVLAGIAVLFAFLFILIVVFIKAVLLQVIAVVFPRRPDLAGAMRLAAAASIPLSLVLFVLSLAATGGIIPRPSYPWWAGFLVWLGFALFGLWSAGRDKGPSLLTPRP